MKRFLNYDQAKKHRLANKIYIKVSESKEELEYCECCNNPLPKRGIIEKLCFFDKYFIFNNAFPSIYFYLKFITTMIFIALIFSISFSLPGYYINIESNNKVKLYCDDIIKSDYKSFDFNKQLYTTCNNYYYLSFSESNNSRNGNLSSNIKYNFIPYMFYNYFAHEYNFKLSKDSYKKEHSSEVANNICLLNSFEEIEEEEKTDLISEGVFKLKYLCLISSLLSLLFYFIQLIKSEFLVRKVKEDHISSSDFALLVTEVDNSKFLINNNNSIDCNCAKDYSNYNINNIKPIYVNYIYKTKWFLTKFRELDSLRKRISRLQNISKKFNFIKKMFIKHLFDENTTSYKNDNKEKEIENHEIDNKVCKNKIIPNSSAIDKRIAKLNNKKKEIEKELIEYISKLVDCEENNNNNNNTTKDNIDSIENDSTLNTVLNTTSSLVTGINSNIKITNSFLYQNLTDSQILIFKTKSERNKYKNLFKYYQSTTSTNKILKILFPFIYNNSNYGKSLAINKVPLFLIPSTLNNAPDPSDIKWENFEFTNEYRQSNRVYSVIVSFVLVIFTFIVVLVLNLIQLRFKLNNNVSFSYLVSCVISIFNMLINRKLFSLTSNEANRYVTEEYFSYAIKITIITSLNTTLIPYFTYQFHGSTLIFLSNLNSILINQAIISPIMTLINISHKVNLLKIFLSKHIKHLSYITPNQQVLNKLSENPQINFFDKYNYLFKSLVFCFSYSHILILAFPLTIIGFFLIFLVEKILIINFYSKPIFISEFFYLKFLDSSCFLMLIFVISKYLFFIDNVPGLLYIEVVDCCLVFFFFILFFVYPVRKLLVTLFKEKRSKNRICSINNSIANRKKDISVISSSCKINSNTKIKGISLIDRYKENDITSSSNDNDGNDIEITYFNMKENFSDSYEDKNPITSKLSFYKKVFKMKKDGLINQEQFESLILDKNTKTSISKLSEKKNAKS